MRIKKSITKSKSFPYFLFAFACVFFVAGFYFLGIYTAFNSTPDPNVIAEMADWYSATTPMKMAIACFASCGVFLAFSFVLRKIRNVNG